MTCWMSIRDTTIHCVLNCSQAAFVSFFRHLQVGIANPVVKSLNTRVLRSPGMYRGQEVCSEPIVDGLDTCLSLSSFAVDLSLMTSIWPRQLVTARKSRGCNGAYTTLGYTHNRFSEDLIRQSCACTSICPYEVVLPDRNLYVFLPTLLCK